MWQHGKNLECAAISRSFKNMVVFYNLKKFQVTRYSFFLDMLWRKSFFVEIVHRSVTACHQRSWVSLMHSRPGSKPWQNRIVTKCHTSPHEILKNIFVWNFFRLSIDLCIDWILLFFQYWNWFYWLFLSSDL